MKKITTCALTLLVFVIGNISEAVILPKEMKHYVINNLQEATVRFDGLVTLSDGTVYIPVIPSQPKEVSNISVVQTYPANSKNPDIIVLNNNYSLLKVIKEDKKCTLPKYSNLPEVIMSGILPQDMLVPNGFYITENMRPLLGNLEIPVVDTTIPTTKNMRVQQKEKQANVNGKKVVKTRKKVLKTNMPPELTNKMYLVTNFDSQYLKVFTPGRPEPIYGLKLKGILKDIKVTPDKKYIIAAVFGKNEVDIADIRNEQIAKSIDIEMQPSEIAINDNSDKFYIMSAEGKSIFAVNVNDMSISEKVSLDAIPYQMTLSPDNNNLAYADKNTNNVYILKLNDNYKNIPVTKCKNISKMILDNENRLYTLSRTENALIVNDFNLSKPFVEGEESDSKGVILQKRLAENTQRMLGAVSFLPPIIEEEIQEEQETASVSEHKIQVGYKPTDMYLFKDKLFVLSSGNSQIEIYDKNQLTLKGKIDIPFNGFPRKITRVGNSNLALVTDTVAKKYAIINLDTEIITGTYPLDIPVYSITIIDKINNINLLEQTL